MNLSILHGDADFKCVVLLAGLQFLVRICSDLGMRGEATEYAALLKKAEKSKEVRERIGSSRPGIVVI
jgi:hypothetical protein